MNSKLVKSPAWFDQKEKTNSMMRKVYLAVCAGTIIQKVL